MNMITPKIVWMMGVWLRGTRQITVPRAAIEGNTTRKLREQYCWFIKAGEDVNSRPTWFIWRLHVLFWPIGFIFKCYGLGHVNFLIIYLKILLGLEIYKERHEFCFWLNAHTVFIAPIRIPRKSPKKRNAFADEYVEVVNNDKIMKFGCSDETLAPPGYIIAKYECHIVFYKIEHNYRFHKLPNASELTINCM